MDTGKTADEIMREFYEMWDAVDSLSVKLLKPQAEVGETIQRQLGALCRKDPDDKDLSDSDKALAEMASKIAPGLLDVGLIEYKSALDVAKKSKDKNKAEQNALAARERFNYLLAFSQEAQSLEYWRRECGGTAKERIGLLESCYLDWQGKIVDYLFKELEARQTLRYLLEEKLKKTGSRKAQELEEHFRELKGQITSVGGAFIESVESAKNEFMVAVEVQGDKTRQAIEIVAEDTANAAADAHFLRKDREKRIRENKKKGKENERQGAKWRGDANYQDEERKSKHEAFKRIYGDGKYYPQGDLKQALADAAKMFGISTKSFAAEYRRWRKEHHPEYKRPRARSKAKK